MFVHSSVEYLLCVRYSPKTSDIRKQKQDFFSSWYFHSNRKIKFKNKQYLKINVLEKKKHESMIESSEYWIGAGACRYKLAICPYEDDFWVNFKWRRKSWQCRCPWVFQAKENIWCKGPKVGLGLPCLRNSKKLSMVGIKMGGIK